MGVTLVSIAAVLSGPILVLMSYAKSFLYAFFSFSFSPFSRCVILASSVEMAALRLRGSSVARRVLASDRSSFAPSSSFRATLASARR